ncbi:hypothetical protein Pelo_2659 [Pelomyxa schiedti]|nr:hypothetical protein Pelo_2659 [Pelomyxa schiedti]
MCRDCVLRCVADECALALPAVSGRVTTPTKSPEESSDTMKPGTTAASTASSLGTGLNPIGFSDRKNYWCEMRKVFDRNHNANFAVQLLVWTASSQQLHTVQLADLCTVACVDCQQPTASYCSTCGPLCDACWVGAHQRHPKIPIKQAVSEVSCNCPKHPKKDVELYCVNCKNLMCSICAFTSHQGHKLLELADQASLSKSELDALSKRCSDQKKKIDVALQELVQTAKSVTAKHETFQSEVDRIGTELITLLQNRISSLKAKSVEICTKTVENLDLQQSVLTQISENLEKSSCHSLAAIQSSSDVSVISSQKLATQTLQTLDSILGESHNLEPCENDEVFSILDKTACCEAISSLGVILPPEEAIGTPGQPKICQASPTSLTLSWDPPPPPTKATRNRVTGYTVFVSRQQQHDEQRNNNQQEEEPQQQQQQHQCGSDPRITVGGLTKGTTYMVSVRAESNGIHGRNSPFKMLSTTNGPTTVEFTFSSNWDHQGVMWWLGTTPDPRHNPGNHTPNYVNPHNSGLVIASWSGTNGGAPQNALVRDCNGSNNTTNEANSWWQVDLRPCGGSVRPSKYSIRHDANGGHCIRNWELRGSNDGTTWTTITRHANDQTIDAQFGVGSWDAAPPTPTSSFSVFRVVMTGLNQSGYNHLMVAGFEIYGLLTVTTN